MYRLLVGSNVYNVSISGSDMAGKELRFYAHSNYSGAPGYAAVIATLTAPH
jgi:hypothetical protein